MLKKILNFVKYNNAFSIGFALIFLSVSGAMAASPEARSAVLGESEIVRSVDNSYLIGTDFSSFSPTVQITSVTEDPDFYYVNYSMNTIDLVDYVWQPTSIAGTMKVEKKAIAGQDLGIYVSKQLKELIDSQTARLKETQDIEKRNGMTQKVVATAYSGLIGRFLDTKEEKFPGYVPVITPKEPVQGVIYNPNQNNQNPSTQNGNSGSQNSSTVNNNSSQDNVPPGITIIGNNPFVLNVGDVYTDPGVLILDNKDMGIVPTISVDGNLVQNISIDTSIAGHHTINYLAKDTSGNTTSVVREVVVNSQSATTTPEVPPTIEPPQSNPEVTAPPPPTPPADTPTDSPPPAPQVPPETPVDSSAQ